MATYGHDHICMVILCYIFDGRAGELPCEIAAKSYCRGLAAIVLTIMWRPWAYHFIWCSCISQQENMRRVKQEKGSPLYIEYKVEKMCEYYFCHSEGDLGIKSNMGACINALKLGYASYQEIHFRDHSKVFDKRDEFLDVYRKLSTRHQDALFALYGWTKHFPPMMLLTFPNVAPLAYLVPSSPSGYTPGMAARPATETTVYHHPEPGRPMIEALADHPKKSLHDKMQIATILSECMQLKRDAIQAFYHQYLKNQQGK